MDAIGADRPGSRQPRNADGGRGLAVTEILQVVTNISWRLQQLGSSAREYTYICHNIHYANLDGDVAFHQPVSFLTFHLSHKPLDPCFGALRTRIVPEHQTQPTSQLQCLGKQGAPCRIILRQNVRHPFQ
jgi:hypothetical protein